MRSKRSNAPVHVEQHQLAAFASSSRKAWSDCGHRDGSIEHGLEGQNRRARQQCRIGQFDCTARVMFGLPRGVRERVI
jgi:hypothetical protein